MQNLEPQRQPGENPAAHTAGPAPAGVGRLHVYDLLLVLVLTLGTLFLIGRYVEEPEASVGFVIVMLAVQSAVPMLAIHLVLVRLRGVAWWEFGLLPTSSRWIRRAVLIAFLTLPMVALANIATQTLAGFEFRNPQIDMLAPEGFTWHGLAGMLVMAGVIVPIVEEIVFRGLLYGWLRSRLGVVPGVVLSAGLFSVAHGIPILIPALFLHGVVLALVHERSGSLWPPIVVHGVFNTVMVIALYAALAAEVPVL